MRRGVIFFIGSLYDSIVKIISGCRKEQPCVDDSKADGNDAVLLALCEEAVKNTREIAFLECLMKTWYEVFYPTDKMPEIKTIVREAYIDKEKGDAEGILIAKLVIETQEAYISELNAEINRLKGCIGEKVSQASLCQDRISNLRRPDENRLKALDFISNALSEVILSRYTNQ